MTAGDLLAIIRADYLDDDVIPGQNWSDTFLIREIGRAQQQACYRQDLRHLFDESFSLTLTEGQQAYPLDPRILRIDDITFDGQPLVHALRVNLDATYRGWRSWIPGIPRHFYITQRTLYLDRAPSAAEDGLTLALRVWREPLIDPMDLDEGDDLEWINDPEQLAHWVAFRAYMRRDEDTQDKDKAAEHLALFNATFGAEVPAQARAELLAYPSDVAFAPMRARPILQEDW